MKKAFFALVAIAIALSSGANLYLVISPEDYSLITAVVLGGQNILQNVSLSGEYMLEVIDGGSVRFSQEIPKTTELVFYDGESGGGAFEKPAPIRAYVPYFSESQVVNLYLNGQKVKSYSFVSLCRRNFICEEGEDYLSCPSDCKKENLEAYNATYIATKPDGSMVPGLFEGEVDVVLEPTPAELFFGLLSRLLENGPYICCALSVITIAIVAGYLMGRRKAA